MAAAISRCGSTWAKFHKHLPSLTNRNLPLMLKGRTATIRIVIDSTHDTYHEKLKRYTIRNVPIAIFTSAFCAISKCIYFGTEQHRF